MSIEVMHMRYLVAVNEFPDPAVIELAEIEVENTSDQFEVGEKFENQNLNAITTQYKVYVCIAAHMHARALTHSHTHNTHR